MMINPDFKERRGHDRVLFNVDIEVCHLSGEKSDSNLSFISCRSRDVSGGGLSFYGQTRYESESLLRLHILLSNGNESGQADDGKLLKVMGKVMWCKKNRKVNSHITGVQFLNIYEEDFQILNEFVNNKLTAR